MLQAVYLPPELVSALQKSGAIHRNGQDLEWGPVVTKDSPQPKPDPIPETMPLARQVRDLLITGRDNALTVESFDAALAVELSHMIAAFNTGCIIQVNQYVPSGD